MRRYGLLATAREAEDTCHEGLRRCQHPQRGRSRARRLRQDPAGRRPAVRRRRVNRFGQVDDGTTVTDYDDEEIARKHTLSASLAWAEWNKTKINLIDTPGFGELPHRRARRRCASPMPRWSSSTRSPASKCRPRRCGPRPRRSGCRALVVVNRLDRERASLDRALASLRESCSRTIIPIQLPLGEEKRLQRASSTWCR